MHTTPVLSKSEMALYHQHLQGDHDFNVWAQVLTMEEKAVGTVDILDGQVNFTKSNEDGPNRMATVTLSDPDGALSFGTTFAEDETGTLWVARLLSLHHSTAVPLLGGLVVEATGIVGVPTSVSRKGAEISLELGDKSLLADRGVKPRTFKRGMRVDKAIIALLEMTGETKYRIPTTDKTLSKPYTVGMGEDGVTPWRLAKRIAGAEKGWRLYYTCDGWAVAEPTATAYDPVIVEHILELPDASASLTEFVNYAKVNSKRKKKNKGRGGDKNKKKGKGVIKLEGVAVLPKEHPLSPESLSRNGVPRLMPLLVNDNSLKSTKAVNARAKSLLAGGSSIGSDQVYEVMPFFHLDYPDKLRLPLGINDVDFDEVSIPLGVGGNMTLGGRKWVSKPVTTKHAKGKPRRAAQKGGASNG
jgi:hypothetical protein